MRFVEGTCKVPEAEATTQKVVEQIPLLLKSKKFLSFLHGMNY
tara:strand:+ start:208 stop:336 length:129 start_codon:yes stop_codon:yes gene_type:complete